MTVQRTNNSTETGGETAPADPSLAESESEKAAARRKFPYDRGFDRAVAEGLLTPQQAMQLGNRNSQATRLVERHGFPLELACDVVDRRIPLPQAVHQRDGTGSEVTELALPVTSSASMQQFVIIAIGVLVAACAILVVSIHSIRSARAGRAVTITDHRAPASHEALVEPASLGPRAEVTENSHGAAVEIAGLTPRAVLDAYCVAADRRGRITPVDLRARGSGSFLGVFRDERFPDQLSSIRIRHEMERQRWVAGSSGETAIPIRPVERR